MSSGATVGGMAVAGCEPMPVRAVSGVVSLARTPAGRYGPYPLAE